MKTILSFSMDKNGNLEISTDNEDLLDKFANPENLDKTEAFFHEVMTKIIGKMWGEKNTCMSKIIRILSMAEMCACAQPYEQAEDFWSTMMFDFIPRSEKKVNTLKQMYGFIPKKVVRPVNFGNTGNFLMGKAMLFPWRKVK